MPTISKGAFKALLQSQGKPPKVLPRQQHPDRIATEYTARLQAIMAWVHSRVRAELFPQLKELTDNASRVATTDAKEGEGDGSNAITRARELAKRQTELEKARKRVASEAEKRAREELAATQAVERAQFTARLLAAKPEERSPLFAAERELLKAQSTAAQDLILAQAREAKDASLTEEQRRKKAITRETQREKQGSKAGQFGFSFTTICAREICGHPNGDHVNGGGECQHLMPDGSIGCGCEAFVSPSKSRKSETEKIMREARALAAAGEVAATGAEVEAGAVVAAEGAELDAIGVTLDRLRAEVAEKYGRAELAGIAKPFGDLTEKFQAEQLNRQLREAVSVDVVGSEAWIGKAVGEFTRENVALIRTISSRYFDEIETLVRREAADGARWEELVSGIEERYDVSRSRSKIIARDQVGKFYGDLNRVRQTDLGITRFIWRTVRDNRVRPEHADLDGHSFTWGSAPEGGPGEAVLCRCYAEPDLTSVVDEVA